MISYLITLHIQQRRRQEQQLHHYYMRHLTYCTHTIFGDNSFTAADLRVWNNLPSYLRQDISHKRVKRQL